MNVVLARHPGDARHASQALLNNPQFLSRGPTAAAAPDRKEP
jgi:hypothetical protein